MDKSIFINLKIEKKLHVFYFFINNYCSIAVAMHFSKTGISMAN